MTQLNSKLKRIWHSDMPVQTKKEQMFRIMVNGYNQKTIDGFKDYHKSRPDIYEMFKQKSYEMKAVRDKYSSKSIMFAIRWDVDLQDHNNEFKITDKYIALYTRKLVLEDADTFLDFFELKQLRGINENTSKAD